MRTTRRLAYLAILVCGGIFWAGFAAEGPNAPVSATIDVLPADLLQAAGQNWTSYNGDYSGKRYSSLDQINVSNVHELRAQWVFHPPHSTQLEVTPVVINGIMFVTSSNDAFAIDARTGRTLWHYSRPLTEGLIDDASQHINRGVAVWRDKVFLETDDAHLLCLDVRSGHLLWDVAYADRSKNKNYGATSAPLVVKDKVLVGTSGGDDGVRGFVAAYEAATGKLAWQFWTIPGPGQFGSSSWPGESYLRGGGSTWMPGTYDPELNTIYWGTSNPSPDFDGSVRPGDDLYTDCVLALDPDTGKLKWYFQFTPHDLFDYDATETPVLIDVVYQKQPRKLLVEANRNGFLYVLDRVDGKFLSATRFVEKLNWATGIDAQGRPILAHVQPSASGTLACPGFAGATNWYSPSYDPSSHTFYFLSLEDCATFFTHPQQFVSGKTYYASGVRHLSPERPRKTLLAYSLDTDQFVWRMPQVGPGRSWGGTLVTAGGLLFYGDDAEAFEAVDEKTGKSLWHFTTGQSAHASPMSYAVSGKQYVAVAFGSDVFSFALPD
jgi:alcohol dehydrogenase (cytochrome c)